LSVPKRLLERLRRAGLEANVDDGQLVVVVPATSYSKRILIWDPKPTPSITYDDVLHEIGRRVVENVSLERDEKRGDARG
jgi:hypothetical protein